VPEGSGLVHDLSVAELLGEAAAVERLAAAYAALALQRSVAGAEVVAEATYGPAVSPGQLRLVAG
jgi:hypothetical protein